MPTSANTAYFSGLPSQILCLDDAYSPVLFLMQGSSVHNHDPCIQRVSAPPWFPLLSAFRDARYCLVCVRNLKILK